MYDRKAVADLLADELAGLAEIVSYQQRPVDLILVISGCPSACPDLAEFAGIPLICVCRPEDAAAVAAEVAAAENSFKR